MRSQKGEIRKKPAKDLKDSKKWQRLTRGGLVEDDDWRGRDHLAGNGEPLPLSPGQAPYLVAPDDRVLRPSEAEQVEQTGHHIIPRGFAQSRAESELDPKVERFSHRHVREKVRLLLDEGDRELGVSRHG